MGSVRDGGVTERSRSEPATRTAVFLAAGLSLLLVGGWLQLRPALRSREVSAETAVGKPLFPELSDPATAASLEILSFDEDTATLSPFKVVKSGGVWVLPSQQNYPADAKDQLAVAATELIDRPILEMVSTSPGDHETYGVIEPDADKIKPGMTGVGQLVDHGLRHRLRPDVAIVKLHTMGLEHGVQFNNCHIAGVGCEGG